MSFSKIISGCMTWGSWGRALSINEMSSLLETYVSMGVTTFDHADIYGGYTTEESFGKALSQSNISPEDIQIISKCGIQYMCDARPENKVKHYQYDESYIIASVENSLRKLQVPYLDLLLLHRPSPFLDREEVNSAISKLISQGKIKDFGVSNFSAHQCSSLQKSNVNYNQIEISLSKPDYLLDDTMPHLQELGIKTMAWNPLGDYFKSPNSEHNRRIAKCLLPLCKKYDLDENQLIIAWLLQHPAQISAVVGTTNIHRMQQILDIQDFKMDIQDQFILLEASRGHKVS